ncbi:MAG: acyl-CoA/acyl-ACP dehydrogenase [Nitrososphaerota archaeon]|nr:acyl-CoA/acyl-ACP dehydrogenase [Nitrososphaerota archaeon]
MQQITAKARLIVAAQALGIGQASLDAAIKYSNERSQFKTTIGSFYAVRDFIAQDEISLQSARSITYSVADEISLFQTPMRDSAIAKIAASDAAVSASRHSIRIHGGYGFIRDYQVERYLRDARATQIYIESNEALKGDIAGSLLGKNA